MSKIDIIRKKTKFTKRKENKKMLVRKKKEPLTPEETKKMSEHLEELNKEIESQMEEAVKLEEELINFMIENDLKTIELEDGTVITLEVN